MPGSQSNFIICTLYGWQWLLQGPLFSFERAAINHALQENRYNKTRTAAALGITFRALRYKLKKLGID